MSFLVDVQAGTKSVPVCSIGLILATLQSDDPQLFEEVSQALTLPVHVAGNTSISRALLARGFHASREVVRRHRYQECQCPVS